MNEDTDPFLLLEDVVPGTEIESHRAELVGRVLHTHGHSAALLFTPFFPALQRRGWTPEPHPGCTWSYWILPAGEGSEGRRRGEGLAFGSLSAPLSEWLWLQHPFSVPAWPHVNRPSCCQAAGAPPPSPGSQPLGVQTLPEITNLTFSSFAFLASFACRTSSLN